MFSGGVQGYYIQDFKVDFITNNRINILLNNLTAVDCQRSKNEKVSPRHRLTESPAFRGPRGSLAIITLLDLSK